MVDFILDREEIKIFQSQCDSIAEKALTLSQSNIKEYANIQQQMESYSKLETEYQIEKIRLEKNLKRLEELKSS